MKITLKDAAELAMVLFSACAVPVSFIALWVML